MLTYNNPEELIDNTLFSVITHSQNQLICFIIDEGNLPIQCAQLLLNRGCTLYGIISLDTSISNWAKDKGIPYIQPTDNLRKFLSQQPFDYLFSIVNNFVLPQEILELPRQCAINYHDAPLPRYAGVNATSWALGKSHLAVKFFPYQWTMQRELTREHLL